MKTFCTFFALLILSVFQVRAQSAADIIDRMMEEYNRSLSGIETMMTVTESDGFMSTDEPDTTYYRKVEVDGISTMEVVSDDPAHMDMSNYNFAKNYQTIAENAVYEGTETLNGESVHVLFFEDVSAFYDGVVANTPENQEPQSGYMYISENTNLMSGMRFDVGDGDEFSGTVTVNMSDYRNIDGMNMPFLIEMTFEGLSGSMTPEEREEAQKNLREFRQQMDEASGMQKQIMERMVAPQMERIEELLAEGSMTMTVTTLSIETNVAIPE